MHDVGAARHDAGIHIFQFFQQGSPCFLPFCHSLGIDRQIPGVLHGIFQNIDAVGHAHLRVGLVALDDGLQRTAPHLLIRQIALQIFPELASVDDALVG